MLGSVVIRGKAILDLPSFYAQYDLLFKISGLVRAGFTKISWLMW